MLNGKATKHKTKAETKVVNGVLKYRVEPHYRAFPGEAQPHWVAVRLDLDSQVTAIWSRGGWATTFHKWPKFLRNDLKKIHQEDMDTGSVVLLRVE